MRLKALAFGLVLVASGCVSTAYDPSNPAGGGGSAGSGGGGSAGSGGGGSAGSGGSGGGGGSASDKSGPISADETWSGAINVAGDVTVNSGVTLTIADGAAISFAAGKALLVQGTLKVQGTSAAGVSFAPSATPGNWNGIQVQSGGSATVSYATLKYPTTGLSCAAGAAGCMMDHSSVTSFSSTGLLLQVTATIDHVTVETGGSGGVLISAGANDTVTITDSVFHHTGGDAVIANSGNLTLRYSHVYGDAAGGNSGVHCATHLATSGIVLADHNVLQDANYGLMASNIAAASKINHNNFVAYGTSATGGGAYTPAGSSTLNAGVDLTNNYWNGDQPPTNTGTTQVQTTYTGAGNMVPSCGPDAPRP